MKKFKIRRYSDYFLVDGAATPQSDRPKDSFQDPKVEAQSQVELDNQKLQSRLQRKKFKIEELKSEIKRLKNGEKASSDKLDGLKQINKEFEGKTRKQQRQISRLESELTETYTRAKIKQSSLRKEIKKLEQRNQNDESLATAMQLQLAEMRKHFASLEDKIQQVEHNIPKCCVCMESPPEMVLMPCFHLCLCQGCFENDFMEKCPTCRATIIGYSRVFF